MLDLALSTERTPHTWDEESFAEEIGRRHGAGARDVIEKLVNWAERKEREMASAVGVRTKTLTRFPTNGTTTEPELWFQVDLDLEPRGTQSTISVRARGDVVVQFGSMRHPPFDAEAARNELRVALNGTSSIARCAPASRSCPSPASSRASCTSWPIAADASSRGKRSSMPSSAMCGSSQPCPGCPPPSEPPATGSNSRSKGTRGMVDSGR